MMAPAPKRFACLIKSAKATPKVVEAKRGYTT
jgi:hypothetical protein